LTRSAEGGLDGRDALAERRDAIARALRFADLLQIGQTLVAALDPGGDALTGQGHPFGDPVQQRERSALAVDLAQQVQSAGDVLHGNLPVQRDTGPGQERQVLQRIPRSGHVPVDHRHEVAALDDPVVGARVVMTDDLVRFEFDLTGLPPEPRTVRAEVIDRIVEVAQPLSGLFEHRIEDDLVVDRNTAALQIRQDLASVIVDSLHLGDTTQSARTQMLEQFMDCGSPRPNGSAYGPTDSCGTADGAAFQHFTVISWHAVIVAHENQGNRDVEPSGDETTPAGEPPPTVVPARPPRPITRRDRVFGQRGRHRSDDGNASEEDVDMRSDDDVPAWQLPPTTDPVDAPPPAPTTDLDQPHEDEISDEPSLEPGGWFRRRTSDSEVEPGPEPDPQPAAVSEPEPDITAARAEPVLVDAQADMDARTDRDDLPAVDERADLDDAADSAPNGRLLVLLTLLAGVAGAAGVVWWRPEHRVSFSTSDIGSDDRLVSLIAMLGVLAVTVVVVGRWKGLRAVIALLLTVATIVLFVLPSINDDASPLGVATTAAVLLTVVAGYLVHGLSRRTASAVAGTLVGVAVTAGLGVVTMSLLDPPNDDSLDLQQVLAGGAVLAVTGLLLDLTTRQAQRTAELRRAEPDAPAARIFGRSLDAAGELVSSSVLTLVFAFVGATLTGLLVAEAASSDAHGLVSHIAMASDLARVVACALAGLVALPVTAVLADRHARRA